MVKRCPICRRWGTESLEYYKRIIISREKVIEDVYIVRDRKGHIFAYGNVIFLGVPLGEMAFYGYKLPYRVSIKRKEFRKILRLRRPFFLRTIKRLSGLERALSGYVKTIFLAKVRYEDYVFFDKKPKVVIYVERWPDCPKDIAIVTIALFSGRLRLYSEFLFRYDPPRVVCLQ